MEKEHPTTSTRNIFRAAAAGTLAAPAAAQAFTIGPIAATFTPWMLLAIPATLALWWVMKSIPQERLKQIFPGIQLLAKVKHEEPSPTKMPWWQYVPITLASLAAVGALTKPEYNPQTPLQGSGPVIMVVDNGWSPARGWSARIAQAENLITRADRAGRSILIVPTAAPEDGSPLASIGPVPAAEALSIIKDMKPQPWPTSRADALETIKKIDSNQKTSVFWLSDGLGDQSVGPLAQKLQELGNVTVIEDDASINPRLIDVPSGAAEKLTVAVRRVLTDKEEKIVLTVADKKGNGLGSAEAHFPAGAAKAEAVFELPNHVANDIDHIVIPDDNTAGARVLLDESFRRRPVGIIQTGTDSLASEARYPLQALAPYAELHQGNIDDLLKHKLAVMIMTDAASTAPGLNKKVEKWVSEEGGTLLRFAGPNLAQQESNKDDPLLPLKLVRGSRTLDGGASGNGPARIAPFPASSPFAGLTPPADVTIREEVLPQPGTDTAGNTWARLDNGTPLVTAKKHGKGQIVLVHTSADPAWSSLAYSQSFIEMLRAVVTSSQGVSQKLENGDVSLPPVRVMDGEGRLTAPTAAVRPLTPEAIKKNEVGPRNPPGFYGNESLQQAHNLAAAVPELKPIGDLPPGVERRAYETGSKDRDLTGYLWGGVFAFLLLDMAVMMWTRRGRRAAPAPKHAP